MTLTITHNKVATLPDQVGAEVNKAEEAIYRNAPRQKLKLKAPLQIDEIKLKEPTQLREVTVAPFIYEIGRMPLANPDQWLLDDDEEAIQWLLT